MAAPRPVASIQQAASISRTILAVVTGTGNHPLVDLEVDDFVVDEGGAPRDILSLHIADYPIVVIIDNTERARDDLQAMTGAAARFVTRIGERPVAIVTLADPTRTVASFGDQRSDVLDRIMRTSLEGAPARAIQAAATGARAIGESGTPFSATVILSARPIPASQASDTDFLTPILDSRTTVYVVADRMPLAPGQSGDQDDVLRALAEQTGGQYTAIYSPVSYAVALDRIADRLAAEMMIEYLVPPGAGSGDVRVGVRIPGATAKGLGVTRN